MYRLTFLLCAAALAFAQAPRRAPAKAPAKAIRQAQETALDRYVRKPDPNFRYDLAKTVTSGDLTGYILDMTSQQYLTTNEISAPLWKHNVVIIRPKEVTSSTALLFISGGSNPPRPPDKLDEFYQIVARSTGAVVAEVRQVPNEPVVMAGETKRRTEDGIIAYTWRKYMETGDEKWPLRLPMTKAAVRAMDAVTGFLASEAGGKVTVDKFVVSGGSKRGWTAWTTAAVDKRVVAAIPVVIDLLNIVPSFTHHYRVYGFFAPAVGDYVSEGVMEWEGTKQYRDLMKIEEPFEYRDRLTMPKYMVNSTGDQFFLPDSSQFYFDQLKGEKHLRYVPNTEHGVTRRSDAAISIAAFFESVVKGFERPKYDWKFLAGGGIELRTQEPPKAVKLWSAHNPNARDFRLEKIGPAYKSIDLQDLGGGLYRCSAPVVDRGYTAYFVEVAYPGKGKFESKFTSGVRVTPDTYPFEAPVHTPPKGAVLLKSQ